MHIAADMQLLQGWHDAAHVGCAPVMLLGLESRTSQPVSAHGETAQPRAKWLESFRISRKNRQKPFRLARQLFHTSAIPSRQTGKANCGRSIPGPAPARDSAEASPGRQPSQPSQRRWEKARHRYLRSRAAVDSMPRLACP
jgi:hypothetical protein